jgi:Flp pilus assembly protein TadG
MNRNAGANHMSYGSRVRHLQRVVAGFRKSRGGIAAVEFALIAPLMLLLLLGTFEVSQAIAAKRKAVLTASTVASIVTQYTSISASQTMPDILNASVAVLTPFSAANAVVTVSCISIDAQGKATIAWSQALNGTARTVGQTMTVPAALDVPNTSLIFGETTYSYTPAIDFMKFGTSTLYSSVYMLPRSGTTVTLGT